MVPTRTIKKLNKSRLENGSSLFDRLNSLLVVRPQDLATIYLGSSVSFYIDMLLDDRKKWVATVVDDVNRQKRGATTLTV